jgi:hypothetical protein
MSVRVSMLERLWKRNRDLRLYLGLFLRHNDHCIIKAPDVYSEASEDTEHVLPTPPPSSAYISLLLQNRSARRSFAAVLNGGENVEAFCTVVLLKVVT